MQQVQISNLIGQGVSSVSVLYHSSTRIIEIILKHAYLLLQQTLQGKHTVI